MDPGGLYAEETLSGHVAPDFLDVVQGPAVRACRFCGEPEVDAEGLCADCREGAEG